MSGATPARREIVLKSSAMIIDAGIVSSRLDEPWSIITSTNRESLGITKHSDLFLRHYSEDAFARNRSAGRRVWIPTTNKLKDRHWSESDLTITAPVVCYVVGTGWHQAGTVISSGNATIVSFAGDCEAMTGELAMIEDQSVCWRVVSLAVVLYNNKKCPYYVS